jgi:hypothetical protein
LSKQAVKAISQPFPGAPGCFIGFKFLSFFLTFFFGR